jgi:hypothetical protein
MANELLPYTALRLKPGDEFRFGSVMFWITLLGGSDEPPFLPVCEHKKEDDADVSGGVVFRCTTDGKEVCLIATQDEAGWVLAVESDPKIQCIHASWHHRSGRSVDEWAWNVQQRTRILLERKPRPEDGRDEEKPPEEAPKTRRARKPRPQ